MSQYFSVSCVDKENLHTVWAICTEIANNMAYPSFFCSGNWLKATTENLFHKDNLLFLVVKDCGGIKALLPLVSKVNLLGGRDLHFMGSDYYPDPLGIICNAADRAESAAAIKSYLLTLPGWDRLILDWIHEDELDAWGIHGDLISTEPFKPLQYCFSDLVGALKRNNRRYLQGKVRKILDAGGALVKSDNKYSHKNFLTTLFSLHKNRADERAIKSSIEGSRVETFHLKLVEESENVRLYGLIINHQMVAVLYGYEFCEKFFAYQIAHDPKYGDLGPGTALLYFAIEDCCERGLTEFNFLQGNETYKGIWTNESRGLYRGVLNRDTWRSNLLNGLKHGKGILKKGLGCIRSGS